MQYQREEFTDELVQEMLPLFFEHYKEIAHFKDIELKPDLATYRTAADSGVLRIYTAREEGRLFGYCVFFVRSNPHYMDSIQAVQDILYLSPEMRAGFNGYRFIRWCDEQLKSERVQAVYHHIKSSHNFGVLLERMGYRLVDLIYTRRLD